MLCTSGEYYIRNEGFSDSQRKIAKEGHAIGCEQKGQPLWGPLIYSKLVRRVDRVWLRERG